MLGSEGNLSPCFLYPYLKFFTSFDECTAPQKQARVLPGAELKNPAHLHVGLDDEDDLAGPAVGRGAVFGGLGGGRALGRQQAHGVRLAAVPVLLRALRPRLAHPPRPVVAAAHAHSNVRRWPVTVLQGISCCDNGPPDSTTHRSAKFIIRVAKLSHLFSDTLDARALRASSELEVDSAHVRGQVHVVSLHTMLDLI